MASTPTKNLSRTPRSPPVLKRSPPDYAMELRRVRFQLDNTRSMLEEAQSRAISLAKVADNAVADYRVASQENALLRRALANAQRTTLGAFNVCCAAACSDECVKATGVRLFEIDCGNRHFLCANALERIGDKRCPLCRAPFRYALVSNPALDPATWRAPLPSDGEQYEDWVRSFGFEVGDEVSDDDDNDGASAQL